MSLPLRPTSAHSLRRQAHAIEIGLRDAEIVEFAHGIGLQIDADAERAHLAHRFEDDARHADLMQRQRRRQPADAAAGDEYGVIHYADLLSATPNPGQGRYCPFLNPIAAVDQHASGLTGR